MSETTPLLIIPTYNERGNITRLLDQVFALAIEGLQVLIVDDSSPDGTQAVVEQYRAEHNLGTSLHVLSRTEKTGLGDAYIAGFKWALARDYAYILQMDADLSHNPKYLPELLSAVKQGADVALGSRYVTGGGTENWGLIRRVISRGGSWYARTVLGLKVRDLTGGFKCFKREVLATIDLDNLYAAGYSFQIEMTYRAIKAGFKVVELPIVFVDRTIGSSKISRKDVIEAVINVPRLRQRG